MNALNFNTLQNFCRMCLKQLEHDSDGNMTDDGNKYNLMKNSRLANLFMSFVDVDLNQQSYNYPNLVCVQCYRRLMNYEYVRLTAQRNQVLIERINNDGNLESTAYGSQSQDNQLLVRSPVTQVNIKSEPPDSDDLPVVNENDEYVHKDLIELNISNNLSPVTIKNEIEIESTDYYNNKMLNVNDNDDKGKVDEYVHKDDDNIKRGCTLTDETSNKLSESTDKRLKLLKSSEKFGRILKCTQCGKKFYKSAYLEAHILRDHEGHEKPFLCNKCDKAFTRYSQLHDHKRIKHPMDLLENALQDAKELTCEMCKRQYSSKRALDQHMKRHADIKEHICEVCGVGKVTRTELQIHLRTHKIHEEEKFKCTLCPQLFSHKNAINRHIRVVHEGQRRYICAKCNKGFGTRTSQKRHELLHGNKRPFICELCNKGFIHMDRLKIHMRSHDKSQWKHICSYCSKRCITRQNLISHESRHSGKKPHICNICSCGFYTADDLNMHKQTACMKQQEQLEEVHLEESGQGLI